MIREIIPRLLTVYWLDKGTVEVEPYYAQASVFAISHDICYLFGQLSQKPLNREYYVDAISALREEGFTKALYFAPKKRNALGGELVHDLLPGLYIIDLEK